MTRIDLSGEHLALVRTLLERHGVGPEHRAIVFGSRAHGGARRYSDLDLGFDGTPLDQDQLRELRAALEESSLPFTVDVLNLTDAVPALRQDARAHGVALQDATPA